MRIHVFFLVLAAWIASVSMASAQDAAMIQTARKEGSVAWYTSLAIPSSTSIAQAFKTKYTGIDVEVHRTGSQRVLQRVMQEASSGIKNADVIHTSDAGHFVLLRDKGLLLQYTPKGVENFPAGFKDKNGFYFGMRATLSVIAYNPKIVLEKDAPHSWKDLLNSKWNGKMVSAHPGYSGIIMTHVLALVNLYGWDYFRDLAKNKLHLVQSANDPAGIVASGERPVGVNGAEYFYYKTQKQGNPIKIVYPKEGIPLVVSPVAIAKNSLHPNAAKLFTEFIFTKESQQLLADKEGLYTGHPEVTYPVDKPKLKDLKLLSADPDELEKRNEEIKKRFVEFFGA
ncbi:MAG TPA: extracellular solute-binding protein [Candidatus Acidoferrales bacterium]|jgi:iron(III) transport system substrate-binding protein|nr:extracellular solute-binding protein [Candidatus Acidoferrales bacterium]